jgi:peptidoglycan hydrolase-like protein with peptidoglycan-binding domain
MRVQFALSNQGYEIGSVDGSLDAKTMAAIYKFQTNSKLIPSGQITDELVRLLEINAV